MSDVKRFVRLDNNYFEVVVAEKGFKLEPVDAMKYLDAEAERVWLGNDQIVTEEDNVFQTVIDETRDTLKKSLKEGIKDTVLGILGFSKRWGGWEIDHCNGRMSSVGDLIAQELKSELMKVQLDVDFSISDKEKAELKAVMRKEFKAAYKQKIGRLVLDAADRLATADVQTLTQELMGSHKKDIAERVMDDLLRVNKKVQK